MRLAIFSDTHSNWVALQAVLADIDAQGPFDQILFAGDLVHGGPQPVECLEAVMERGISGIYGNSEERIIHPNVPIPSYILENPEWLAGYHAANEWTDARLNADHRDFLRELPFSLTISPTENSQDSLLIVHATPFSVTHGMLPPEDWQKKHLKEVRQSDARVLELLEDVEPQTIVYGHVHVPSVRQIGDYQLVNVSSVSRQQDWDLRAKYAILEFEAGTWQAEHRYIEYDIDAAIQAYIDAEVPHLESATHWLRHGGEDNW